MVDLTRKDCYMITLEVLQSRRESLANTLMISTTDLEMLNNRIKVIKKEIAHINGGIIELDRMIESLQGRSNET